MNSPLTPTHLQFVIRQLQRLRMQSNLQRHADSFRNAQMLLEVVLFRWIDDEAPQAARGATLEQTAATIAPEVAQMQAELTEARATIARIDAAKAEREKRYQEDVAALHDELEAHKAAKEVKPIRWICAHTDESFLPECIKFYNQEAQLTSWPKITMIKFVRERTGMSLREAKAFVEKNIPGLQSSSTSFS